MTPRRPQISRRRFLSAGGAAAAVGVLGFPYIAKAATRFRKIMVLGVDGMDPGLLTKLLRSGDMPNFAKLAKMGCFTKLGTSDPPQSPVAWSNFISGTNPGGHGIFDFIARDSETLVPFLSTSRMQEPTRELPLGKFSLPIGGGTPELLREGPTLWKIIEDAGIASTAFRAPVNFPPTPTSARTLSGITTPDVHGSYGVFSYYANVPGTRTREVAGGRLYRTRVRENRAEAVLDGPVNSFRKDRRSVEVPFTVDLDPDRPIARIRIQDHTVVLRQGEWSDWITIRFDFIPYVTSTTGICRLFLKQAQPFFELYISPVNIDPANPAMPISTPGGLSRRLVRDVGYFYTQGMPEDTAALSAGVFDDDLYREQATFVLEERLRFLRYELDRYRDGFFYFYFSSLDLNSHAFWRTIDPGHPLYTEELHARHGDFLPYLYRRIDEALGWTMSVADEDTLVAVVSDHGFVPFRRQFNLNSWLADHGYARLKPGTERGERSYFLDTDWGQTRAYGLGINALYVNVKGREPDGTVSAGEEYEAIRNRLIAELEALRDPATGDPVILRVYRPEDIYSGPYIDRAPDLVVGYNENYRASWDTILGAYPKDHVLDNLDPWSGDHCMDRSFLSGVLVCNRPIRAADPALHDLAPTILTACALTVPAEMTGRDLFAT